uniref:RING-type domain-containing protein n=1 Tax=Mycena chlorophos TaxID=658473 RepID=A0ABQ0L8R0_MYCCL|nr:predicted protein [Mycena chlorophos]
MSSDLAYPEWIEEAVFMRCGHVPCDALLSQTKGIRCRFCSLLAAAERVEEPPSTISASEPLTSQPPDLPHEPVMTANSSPAPHLVLPQDPDTELARLHSECTALHAETCLWRVRAETQAAAQHQLLVFTRTAISAAMRMRVERDAARRRAERVHLMLLDVMKRGRSSSSVLAQKRRNAKKRTATKRDYRGIDFDEMSFFTPVPRPC